MVETAVVLRAGAGGVDRYGNDIRDWDDATETDVSVLGFAPRGDNEDRADGRQGGIHTAVLYLPTGTDITTVDRVRVRDATYEVDGVPADWRNPYTGTNHGLEVNVRRVTG